MYYSLYAVLVVFIVGSVVSFIVEKANLVKIEPLDKRYYIGFSFKHNRVDPNLDRSEEKVSIFDFNDFKFSFRVRTNFNFIFIKGLQSFRFA